jgi:hypothetical protein
MQNIPHEESLIEYPCEFPIKVMGLMHDTFTQTMVDVVMALDPTFHAGKVEI